MIAPLCNAYKTIRDSLDFVMFARYSGAFSHQGVHRRCAASIYPEMVHKRKKL
jgi:hypothetical protein